MTGFGRASVEAADRRLRVEIRSVNHRGLDIKVRGSELDAYCDVEVARAIRGGGRAGRGHGPRPRRIERGRRRHRRGARAGRVSRRWSGCGRSWRSTSPSTWPPSAAFMTAAGAGVQPEGESLWADAAPRRRPRRWPSWWRPDAARATRSPPISRSTARSSSALSSSLRQATATLPDKFARRLEERLVVLRGQAGVDAGRIAQEVALMAERLDVAEELVRLDTHLGHFRELLAGTGAVGRKLDFVDPGDRPGAEHHRFEVAGRGRGRPGDRSKIRARTHARAGPERRVRTGRSRTKW